MKLYYSPGACSLSPHIALREAGLPFSIEKVDTRAGTTETGKAFATVNPKGYVPALQLDDGAVLTEGAAIVQFIADLAPDAGLAPKASSFARTRLQEELNFIATELHKAFVPLLRPTTSEDGKRDARAMVTRRLDHVERTLSDGRDHLLGKDFSVADAYLFTVVNWGGHVGLALEPWPRLQAFMSRVAARNSVQQAMRAEGLIQ
jgi:glutathione S-transferase